MFEEKALPINSMYYFWKTLIIISWEYSFLKAISRNPQSNDEVQEGVQQTWYIYNINENSSCKLSGTLYMD